MISRTVLKALRRVSGSRLYATALAEYPGRRQTDAITERLNEVYSRQRVEVTRSGNPPDENRRRKRLRYNAESTVCGPCSVRPLACGLVFQHPIAVSHRACRGSASA